LNMKCIENMEWHLLLGLSCSRADRWHSIHVLPALCIGLPVIL